MNTNKKQRTGMENIKVKNMRQNEVLRFKPGDIVYPIYNFSNMKIWGVVMETMPEIHKVIVDIAGKLFQYEPNELIHVNPELAKSKKTASMTKKHFRFIRG